MPLAIPLAIPRQPSILAFRMPLAIPRLPRSTSRPTSKAIRYRRNTVSNSRTKGKSLNEADTVLLIELYIESFNNYAIGIDTFFTEVASKL